MKQVLLGLGSSLGNKKAALFWGRRLISLHPQIKVLCVSRIFRSAPMGAAQALFLNQCCLIQTQLSPTDLLAFIKTIEKRVGRKESTRWSDRILDIDILLYEQECVDTSVLTIPHPSFQERSFVIQPAQEIAQDWFHPVLGVKIKDLPVPFPRCW